MTDLAAYEMHILTRQYFRDQNTLLVYPFVATVRNAAGDVLLDDVGFSSEEGLLAFVENSAPRHVKVTGGSKEDVDVLCAKVAHLINADPLPPGITVH